MSHAAIWQQEWLSVLTTAVADALTRRMLRLIYKNVWQWNIQIVVTGSTESHGCLLAGVQTSGQKSDAFGRLLCIATGRVETEEEEEEEKEEVERGRKSAH
jgi:hypothetical protein